VLSSTILAVNLRFKPDKPVVFTLCTFASRILIYNNTKFAGMFYIRHLILLVFLCAGFSVFAGTPANKLKCVAPAIASPPPPGKDTIVIRFEYKQSALFHKYTLETLDSVIRILLRDTAITLSIDGFAYKDEGSDTICYYLSLNRALFIQAYVLGRGVALTRISNMKAWGRTRQKYVNKDKNGLWVNCRAELRLVYPPPPKKKDFSDKDEDGIADDEDKCPTVFGLSDFEGCPDSGAIAVPFPIADWALTSATYNVLDSVIKLLKDNSELTITIDGHAHLAEGSYAMCTKLAAERAGIVKNYLLSRQVNQSKILEINSYGISRPVNAAKNPQQVLKNARAEIRLNGYRKPSTNQKAEVPFIN
jgi:outer membrane protein OmpA-like peptidoglycan-associated protein